MAANQTSLNSSAAGATSVVLLDSSFFKEQRAAELPSPANIRDFNISSGNSRGTSFRRPSPVIIPSLRLFVKYGSKVTVAEAESQIYIRKRLEGKVLIPEIFGWAQDRGQCFIYMSLIEGDTLHSRFSSLGISERQVIYQELSKMVKAWRAVGPEEFDPYGKRPLRDVFLNQQPELARPFFGAADAVQQFQNAWRINVSGEATIVFTHSDLCPPNILISRRQDPKIVGIIDWGQSGWYPDYWEYCKARRVGVIDECFDYAAMEEWATQYVTRIIDPVDDEMVYHPWLYFMLANT